MSDISQGPGWWLASDGKWYAPEQHPNYQPPSPPQMATPQPSYPPPFESTSYSGQSMSPGLYFEQVSGLQLPQGVQLATSGRRIGAFFLSIVLGIVTLGIGYLIWGLIVWGRGQTPALQVLGLRCWRPETGKVAGWGWMALREIVGRFAEGIFSLVTLLISFILMVSRSDRRCIHDLVAGTVVLYDPNKVLSNKVLVTEPAITP